MIRTYIYVYMQASIQTYIHIYTMPQKILRVFKTNNILIYKLSYLRDTIFYIYFKAISKNKKKHDFLKNSPTFQRFFI